MNNIRQSNNLIKPSRSAIVKHIPDILKTAMVLVDDGHYMCYAIQKATTVHTFSKFDCSPEYLVNYTKSMLGFNRHSFNQYVANNFPIDKIYLYTGAVWINSRCVNIRIAYLKHLLTQFNNNYNNENKTIPTIDSIDNKSI